MEIKETQFKKVAKLLSKGDSNAKTAKNFLETHILYLSPFTKNARSINVCPWASNGCVFACLDTAGMGIFSNVQEARINKTNYYLFDKTNFSLQLVKELRNINKRAQKTGQKVAIRLNGTSDLDFIAILKNRTNVDIIEEFPNLEYYDYTKSLAKAQKYANSDRYTLTFSRSETNEADCIQALKLGFNVSVVFDHKKQLPTEFLGRPVIDGDEADDLMITNRGVILGLKAKGRAKKDTTGFVVR
jgi:hypothetical protein